MRTPGGRLLCRVMGSIRAVGFQAGRCLNGHPVLARHIDGPQFLRIQELSPCNVLHAFPADPARRH
jgi:hypothetical protein